MKSRRVLRHPLLRGLAMLSAAFSCVAAAGAAPPPGPPAARQVFVVTDFDTIRLDAPVDAVIVSGKGASAIGTGDRETLDALDLRVSGRILTIRMRSGIMLGGTGDGRGGRARTPTRIALTTGDLARAIVQGTGTLSVDRLKAQRVEATVRGSGTLSIAKVDADQLDAGLLGAGSLTLAGKTLQLVAAISGSGRLDATALDARRVRIESEGAVEGQVKAREEAVVAANGTGRLTITGPATCTVRKMGSGTIACGGAVY